MKYTEEEKYAIGYYMDKEISVELEINDDKGEFLKALGITENDNFESHLIRVKTLLHLIEKQNKEINEKDKLLKFNRNYINKLEQDLFENASNYVISKEAIREKIKELKDNRPYLSKFDDWKEKEYTNEDINNMCVEVLEDLLGDE